MFPKASIALCTLIISIAGLSGCSNDDSKKIIEEAIRPVKLVSTGINQAQEISKFPALVSADQFIELSFTSGGKLIEFPVKDALQVKKGDIIARLDQSDFENNLVKARAQYQNAETEYKRLVRLSKSNAVSRSSLQQGLTERDISLSQLKSAQKALNDSTIKAPFDGFIAQKMVNKGESISAGKTIAILIGGNTLEASIDIPASYLAHLYKTKNEQQNIETYIKLDIQPKNSILATYKEAVLIADTATQTYTVKFEFSAPENLLVLPGMNATVEVHLPAAESVNNISIPMSAITSDGATNYVWVVNKQDMTVAKRDITINEGIGETMTVASGLERDELIVSAGVAYLYQGMKVREWK